MTVTRSHDETAIKGVLEGVYQAWDAGDADAFVADYRDDATAILPGSYRRSKEVVRENMAVGFASYLKGSTSIDKLDSIRFLGESAAVVVSETGIKFPGESEVPPSASCTRPGCSRSVTAPGSSWPITTVRPSCRADA